MPQPQSTPPEPVRAASFLSLILVLSSVLGSALQLLLGLNGVMLTEFLIFLGVALFFAQTFDHQPLSVLFRLRRLRWSGVIKSVVLGLVAWALVNIMGSLIIHLVTYLGGHIPEAHTVLAKAPLPLALVAGALVPAICEEAAFRGYIQWNLGPLGPIAAPIVTGLLFGGMHLTLVRLLPLVTLGVLFAVAVQRSGSILPGIIMHFLNNAISLVLSALPKTAAANPTPALPNRLTLIVMVVMLLCLAASAWGLALSFGKQDAEPGPEATGEAHVAAAPAFARGRFAVALLPALFLWVWQVLGELTIVMRKV